MSKHINRLEEFIQKQLKDVDMIIHAGDYTSIKVIEKIKEYKKFIGVYGNNDKGKIRGILNEKEIIGLNGYKIGIYHGHGDGKNTLDRAYEMFKKDRVDIIIFGHSHKPTIQTRNKVLMINPGSLTKKIRERNYSYVILDLKRNHIETKVVFFDK